MCGLKKKKKDKKILKIRSTPSHSLKNPEFKQEEQEKKNVFGWKETLNPAICKSCLSVFSYIVFVSASSPASDAAGHNGVYLRARLDHLSRHGGKRRARCRCVMQLFER